MGFLLDANVLIALGDRDHVHHERVSAWFFDPDRKAAWATCPLTENAFLRIVSSPSYPNPVPESSVVRDLLARMCSWPGHQFWPDTLSFRDVNQFPNLPPSKHLTDAYLLGLAVKRRGHLATLDQRILPTLVPGGRESLFLIP